MISPDPDEARCDEWIECKWDVFVSFSLDEMRLVSTIWVSMSEEFFQKVIPKDENPPLHWDLLTIGK
jgi:hypothetical protein